MSLDEGLIADKAHVIVVFKNWKKFDNFLRQGKPSKQLIGTPQGGYKCKSDKCGKRVSFKKCDQLIVWHIKSASYENTLEGACTHRLRWSATTSTSRRPRAPERRPCQRQRITRALSPAAPADWTMRLSRPARSMHGRRTHPPTPYLPASFLARELLTPSPQTFSRVSTERARCPPSRRIADRP